MPHPFSNALYYPSIDIRNQKWLKTATLFWDSISTIVPESIYIPYRNNDTEFLNDIGYLTPIRVNSNSTSVTDIEQDILSILSSPEIIHYFFEESFGEYSTINSLHADKMTILLMLNIEQKLNESLKRDVHSYLHKIYDKSYYVGSRFACIYMTILANKICERNSLAMVTDLDPLFAVGNSIRYGNQSNELYLFDDLHIRNREMAQGILLNYIIQGLSVSPDTSLYDIIRFKESHRDELGKFKMQLAKLTDTYGETDIPMDTLQREIKDVYENDFLPSYNDLKAALSGFNIKWFTDSFIKISAISTSATSLPMALVGLPLEQALFAGLGMSIIATSVNYNLEKKHMLRNNPYSYLFAIQNEWY